MIYFDITRTGAARHHSGMMRVSARLREEFGAAVTPAVWNGKTHAWHAAGLRSPVSFGSGDRLLTAELFSEAERPGFWDFLRARPCRLEAVFYDAIPLKYPHITWPQSVARHPGYLKMLASFDRVWAISEASRNDLVEFWRWQGAEARAAVGVLALGADFDRSHRVASPRPPVGASLLCVGILEPRKNQTLLLDACEALWAEGLEFELNLVGRVNPHFGKPIAARVKALCRRQPRMRWHKAAPDAALCDLYANTRATAFPSIAEGGGLPVLESLWKGLPCVCSDLPVLREAADGGGCLTAAPDDAAAWKSALRTVLTNDTDWIKLAAAAAARPLPTWADAARALLAELK